MNRLCLSATRRADAQAHYRQCLLCEHRCGVNRLAGERGVCKAGPVAHVFKHRVEYGEELELIPSHLFYLSGCDLRCAFCIAEVNAFDPRRGIPLTADFFHKAVASGRDQGARTLQWVGGEPTIHLPAILEVMANEPELPPIIWKSDFHMTPEAMTLLDGVIDIYLADFKFGNDDCAKRLASIGNYLTIVTRNLEIAARQGQLIVRHLLLPGHFDCCYRPVVRWLRAHLPAAALSVRDCYLPSWQSRHYEELARPLGRDEGPRARELAVGAGLQLVE